MMKQTVLSVLCYCLLGQLLAQDITVRGLVFSAETGDPLQGVAIELQGSPRKATSNEQGFFQIDVPPPNIFYSRKNAILVFTLVGHESLEVDVGRRREFNLSMKRKVDLEVIKPAEIIYTGTADGQSPKGICFSVDCLDENVFLPVPPSYLGQGLQGKVPGLKVNQLGAQPGQGAFLQLRSANSIANGQQPLILLDGIYLNGASLADINPEDIDKVEVLKGAAGASLFGSQAANGVIQFFTKRGKTLDIGRSKVTLRTEYGFSEEAKRFQLNSFTNRTILNPDGPQPVLGNFSPTQVHDEPLPNLQDYQESILFQPGQFQSHNLSIMGRTNVSNYLFSMQRLRDEGVVQANDGYTRHAFRLNLDHRLNEKFDFSLSSMFSASQQDLLTSNANGPQDFLATVLFLTPIFELEVPNEEDGSNYDWDIDNTGKGITNPLYQRANSQQIVDRSRFMANASAGYFLKDWLQFRYTATLDRATNSYEHFIEKGFLSTTIPGFFGPLATADQQLVNGGGIHRSQATMQSFTSRIDAIARRSFTGFNTSWRASFLYEDFTQQYNEARGENLAVAGIRSLDNAQSNIQIASEAQEIIAYSGFLIGDIDYKEKYIFSGLFRRESTSLFGPEERTANYYRLSGAYRLSKDAKIKGFQELKLRASIGTAGIRPAFEQRFETFSLQNGTATKNTLGNTALRPATSTEMEVGINATFWKAFDLEFNYSQIKTEDQILMVPLSGAAGFTGQWQNAGTINATIYEARLNTNLARLFKIDTKSFQWDVAISFDRVQQQISSLDIPSYLTGPGLQQTALFLVEEGQSFGTMVGEVFATSLDQLADQDGINPGDYVLNAVGYVVHKDQLGTPEERPYKLLDSSGNALVQTIGNTNPRFRMGFMQTFGYKGLQLYGLFDWKKGGDVYNLSKQWLYRDQRHADLSAYENTAGGFFSGNGLYNNLVANNHFVEDGSFLMLREASLSYTLQKGQLGGVLGKSIDRIKLSLIGRNLMTWTQYSGVHPDVSSLPNNDNTLGNRVAGAPGSDRTTPNGDPSIFAVDAFNYPLRKTYTFSLQITF
ncbi:MAG: SusC/RagA family TonB-linked outer membrane protein [Saprospiraceae bacterium]